MIIIHTVDIFSHSIGTEQIRCFLIRQTSLSLDLCLNIPNYIFRNRFIVDFYLEDITANKVV